MNRESGASSEATTSRDCINRKRCRMSLLPKFSQREVPSSAPPLEEGIRGPSRGPHSSKVPATPHPKGKGVPRVMRCAHSCQALGLWEPQPKRPRAHSQAFPRAADWTPKPGAERTGVSQTGNLVSHGSPGTHQCQGKPVPSCVTVCPNT